MSDLAELQARADAFPEDPRAQYALGVALLAGGAADDLPRALEALRAAVALDGQRADCRAALGCALERAGDVVPGAANALYAATLLAPDDALFQAYHASLLARSAPPDVAQATLERACKQQRIELKPIRAALEREGLQPTPALLAERAFPALPARVRAWLDAQTGI